MPDLAATRTGKIKVTVRDSVRHGNKYTRSISGMTKGIRIGIRKRLLIAMSRGPELRSPATESRNLAE